MAADIGQIGDILYFSLFIPGVKLVRVPLSPKQHPKRYVCVLGLQTLKDRSSAACVAQWPSLNRCDIPLISGALAAPLKTGSKTG